MNWHTRQIRELERKRNSDWINPPSDKPKLQIPRNYQCNNCIQAIGSSMCKSGGEKGEPCEYYTKLLAMSKRGELEYQETS